jgi:carboxyl-terminal processing protease
MLAIAAALALSLVPTPSTRAASLDCQILPQVFDVYLRAHYVQKTLSDTIRVHTVEQFIENLDPSRTLLLEGDVQRLQNELPNVFMTMQTGNCEAINRSLALVASRASEEEAFVRKFLGPDYKLDETIELVTDPKKRGYPKTLEDKQALLVKMVHFQISNYLLTGTKLPDARMQLIHRYELVTRRTKELKPADAITFFAEAFALALDPHSSYMSKENFDDFQIQLSLSLEGIGASLSSQDGFAVIEDLIPGGGAEKSGQLRLKDKIVGVAQEGEPAVTVIDMELKDVVKMIRGKRGTKVTLTVLRQADTTRTFDVTIVRDKIDIKDQAANITYETREHRGRSLKFGIIDLPSFYGGNEKDARTSYRDVAELLEQAKKEKVDGVMLNVSRNGGGLLEDAVRISGLFLRKGAIVATKDTTGKVAVLSDPDDNTQYSGPLVVLTSRLSASASEILAGTLKDYRRAVIVGGDHTFGKGSVQALSVLPRDLGTMRVTTSMFFLPGGASTQQKGVAADVVLPSVYSNDDVGEKTLDYSLLPQAVPPFVSQDVNAAEAATRFDALTGDVLKQLAQRSAERVSKDPKFNDILREMKDSARNKGVIRLAEARKKAQDEEKKNGNTKDDTRAERIQRVKDLDAPYVQESLNILADLIVLRQN